MGEFQVIPYTLDKRQGHADSKISKRYIFSPVLFWKKTNKEMYFINIFSQKKRSISILYTVYIRSTKVHLQLEQLKLCWLFLSHRWPDNFVRSRQRGPLSRANDKPKPFRLMLPYKYLYQLAIMYFK